MSVICLSSQPWDDPLWTNKQHVMIRLARRGHRVLFVDPVRTVPQYLAAARKTRGARESAHSEGDGSIGSNGEGQRPPAQRLDGVGVRDARERSENPWTVAPLVPLERFRWLAQVNTSLVVRQIRSAAAHAGLRDVDVIWVYYPDFAYVAEALATGQGRKWGARGTARHGKPLLVYDCVDAYSEFPNASSPERRRRVEEREGLLLSRADLVFASAPSLYEKCRAANPSSHLVPNVADVERFRLAATALRSSAHSGRSPGGFENGDGRADDLLPPDLRGLPRPLIGFVGALDSYKVDFPLLHKAASGRPDWSWVLIGPRGHADPGTDVGPLEKLPNVHFLGLKAYEEVPSYVAAFDVAVIPYVRNSYTDHVFPLKVHEFLAAGKPVVATALPNLEHLRPTVRLADSAEEFLAEVEGALADPDADSSIAARQALAGLNTWDHRVGRMLELVRESMDAAEKRA